MKKQLREKLKAILADIPPAQFAARSQATAERLLAQPEYIRCQTLMIYLSMPTEVDTTPVVLQAWQDGKRVVAPQVSWESRQMIPLEIRDLDTALARNEFGFKEPVQGQPIPIELIELVVVPGLAFDGAGNRLGRGRGFYDRFLGRPGFRGIACGFALESQVVDAVPSEPLDRRMQMLVTDQQVRRFNT